MVFKGSGPVGFSFPSPITRGAEPPALPPRGHTSVWGVTRGEALVVLRLLGHILERIFFIPLPQGAMPF